MGAPEPYSAKVNGDLAPPRYKHKPGEEQQQEQQYVYLGSSATGTPAESKQQQQHHHHHLYPVHIVEPDAQTRTEPAEPHPAFVTDQGPTLLLATTGDVFVRRSATINLVFWIVGSIFVLCCLTVGLAANAAANIDLSRLPDAKNPQGVIVIAVAGVLEIIPFLILAVCFIFCNSHLAFFIMVAIIAVLASASGLYGLVITAMSMHNSVCVDDGNDSGNCQRALEKGLAASCLRLFLTAPIAIYFTYWYFAKARKEIKRSRGNEPPRLR